MARGAAAAATAQMGGQGAVVARAAAVCAREPTVRSVPSVPDAPGRRWVGWCVVSHVVDVSLCLWPTQCGRAVCPQWSTCMSRSACFERGWLLRVINLYLLVHLDVTMGWHSFEILTIRCTATSSEAHRNTVYETSMSAHASEFAQPHRAHAAERRTDVASTRLSEAAVTTARFQCSAPSPRRAGPLAANLLDDSGEAVSPKARRGNALPRCRHRAAGRPEPCARRSGTKSSL